MPPLPLIALHLVPILRDNYAFIVENKGSECLIIDPGQTTPIESFIESRKLKPLAIFNTHHHADHVAGNAVLKALYGIKVYAPLLEMKMIPASDIALEDGKTVEIGGMIVEPIATPGHTQGHLCFHFPQAKALFCGDTLFSLGCGRLFEGTAEEMFSSLGRLACFPDDTLIYCAHEYTRANGFFAQNVLPQNKELFERLATVNKLLVNGQPSLPVPLGIEKKTNPFLMAQTVESFTTLRRQKDDFTHP